MDPLNLSADGTALHMIEPTSIPHTTQLVRWMSPFGPDPSPPYAGDGRETITAGWVEEFERVFSFLDNCATQTDWAANEIRRRTTGQQDNADRRAFRRTFAAMIGKANPDSDAKADSLGAAVFSLVWGSDMSEESYRAMRHREEKAMREEDA